MKNNYLIKNKDQLFKLGLPWIGSLGLLIMILLSGGRTVAQTSGPCTVPVDFTVQTMDESVEDAGDAKMIISGVPNATYLVGYTVGPTYSGSDPPPNVYSALVNPVEANTLGKYLSDALANPAASPGTIYTIRLQENATSCYTDLVDTLPRVNWSKAPEYSDLEVTVEKSGDAEVINQNVTITVTVLNRNDNPGATGASAEGVEIQVITPAAGMTFVTAVGPNAPNLNTSTMVWSIGTMPAGDSLVLQLTYTMVKRGVFQIGAEVKTTTGTNEELDSVPYDANTLGNFGDEDDEGSVCVSTPWDWCTGDSFSFQLISSDYSGITWFKTPLGGGASTELTGDVPGSHKVDGNGLTIYDVGSYNFVYTSGLGAECDAVGCCPVDVVQGKRPFLEEMAPNAICLGADLPTPTAVDTSIVYDPDRGNVLYQWYQYDGTDSTAAIAGQESLVLDLSTLPLVAGIYHYKIMAWDSLHATCLDSTTYEFEITDIEEPVANANSPICEEKQMELTVTNMGDFPSAAYVFSWWDLEDSIRWVASGDSVGIISTVAPDDSGRYVVQVFREFTSTFSSGNINTSCAKTDTVLMVINPLPEPPVMQDSTYCQFTHIEELVWHVVDSTGGYLKWYDPGNDPFLNDDNVGITATLTKDLWLKPDSSIAGKDTYYVTLTDANGCQSYPDSFFIQIDEIPEPPIVSDLAYCEDATITESLTATAIDGNYSLTWYDDTLATGAGGTPADPTPPTPVSDNIGIFRFYVTQTKNLAGSKVCESRNAMLSVYIKDTPEAPSYVNPEYCYTETAVPLNDAANLTLAARSTTAPYDSLLHWDYPGFTDDGVLVPTPLTTESGSNFGLVWEEWIYDDTLSCPGPSEDFRVITNPEPDADLLAIDGLCIGSIMQDNASLYLTQYRDTDVLLWHVGSTFNPSDPGLAASQTGVDIRTAGGAFATSLTNPSTGATTYAVQITNEFNCVITNTIDLATKECICPGGYCEPASVDRIL
jgi:hypothetical protein